MVVDYLKRNNPALVCASDNNEFGVYCLLYQISRGAKRHSTDKFVLACVSTMELLDENLISRDIMGEHVVLIEHGRG